MTSNPSASARARAAGDGGGAPGSQPPDWSSGDEPFQRTLARNAVIALAVGAVFAVRSGELALLPRVALVALWFSLGGHCVELVFLRGVRPRIPRRRAAQLARSGCLPGMLAPGAVARSPERRQRPIQPPSTTRTWPFT